MAAVQRLSAWRDLRWPVAAYVAVASVVVTIQYAGSPAPRSWDGVWIRYDVGAYLTIAREGYTYHPSDPFPMVAWFPGFPLVVKAVMVVVSDAVIAGVVVSLASGLVASVLFWRWLATRGVTGTARLVAHAALLLYAWGWFQYGVPYADSCFIALALAAFLLLDRDRLVAACLVAAVATAVRPTGMALVAGMVGVLLERDGGVVLDWPRRQRPHLRIDRGRLRAVALAPLTGLAGIVAFSAYLWARYGEPLLWLRVQDSWSQGPWAGPKSWFKIHFLGLVFKEHDLAYLAKALPQLALALLVVAALPAVHRRFGLGASAYTAATLVIVIGGTNDFVGVGRYLLGAFPVLALLGERLGERPRWAVALLAASSVAMLGQTLLFARDVYLT